MGHRITGNPQQGRSTGVDYDRVHVAIDDATRFAHVEALAVAWFNAQGVERRQVMSDNGSAHIAKAFAKPCRALGLKYIRTRLYTPRTNGKAERFIQTLCKEMALCDAVPELPGAKRLAASLPVDR